MPYIKKCQLKILGSVGGWVVCLRWGGLELGFVGKVQTHAVLLPADLWIKSAGNFWIPHRKSCYFVPHFCRN